VKQNTGSTANGADGTLTDLSVVVLSHNRREELLRNLESLCALQSAAAFELLVVDNGSTDGTREQLLRLRERHSSVIVVLSDENLGVAKGRNLGWSVAKRSFILNLDDDTHVDLEAIIALRQAALDSDLVGIVTPRIMDAATGALQSGYADKAREVANFAGACHLVRRSVWERVGALDPDCAFGGEEIDYSIRARAAGYATVSLGEVTARHHGVARAAATARRRQEQWVYNYARVVFKHFPISRALMLSGRLLVGHLASGVRVHGPAIVPALVLNTLHGAVAGRQRYSRLPEAVLRFYRNPALLPDFGNVPLWRKAFACLRAGGRSDSTRDMSTRTAAGP
jgi:GT2 family glycosyltransferase